MKDLQQKLSKIKKFDLTGYSEPRLIGSGTYGYVFLTSKGDDNIAYKIFIRPNNSVDIEREIKNLARCSQFEQLIIGFRGISFTDIHRQPSEYPILVLDYKPNGSLYNYLENNSKKLTYTEIMILIYGIAKAMESIHFYKITHRDLKPGNILLDDNLYPILTDFGSSRTFDCNSSNDTTCDVGSLAYMAPEVIDGSIVESTCYKADVFSFAMIIYTLLTGRRPYDGYLQRVNGLSIIDFLKTQRFELPDNLPTHFKYFILFYYFGAKIQKKDQVFLILFKYLILVLFLRKFIMIHHQEKNTFNIWNIWIQIQNVYH